MNTQFIYFSLPLITTYLNPEGIEKKDAGIFKIKHSLMPIAQGIAASCCLLLSIATHCIGHRCFVLPIAQGIALLYMKASLYSIGKHHFTLYESVTLLYRKASLCVSNVLFFFIKSRSWFSYGVMPLLRVVFLLFFFIKNV